MCKYMGGGHGPVNNFKFQLQAVVWRHSRPNTGHSVVAVVGFLLSGILSRFKPGAMVKTLSKTVEETYIHYNGHKDVLNEAAGFEDKINRLRVEAFKLQERRLQAPDDFLSWTDCRSWRHYMRETKDIWVEARQRKREIVELKKELKLEQSGTSSRRVWGTTVKEGERRPGARNLMGVPSFEEVIADIHRKYQPSMLYTPIIVQFSGCPILPLNLYLE
ncbi:hypothetical protein EDD18DRAFT_1106966 [Armillaria luteobubalina]|uniref:Uncharacterized protein n=1 Tax=Armillaria luteobubalina TaxID=153913 RepID=A0AA39Q2F8_9AGAR|nr:hypothetical protein EDD18DRAFT_1106966 [Armillaria luteobubalina]